MSDANRRETAKIYLFPQRRSGEISRGRADRAAGTKPPAAAPVVIWDGWYHDAAIAAGHTDKG